MEQVDPRMAAGTIHLERPFGEDQRQSGYRLYLWLIGIDTVLLIGLPTGNVFGLNVKMLAFVPLFCVTLAHAIGRRANPYWMLSWLAGLPLFFSFWLFPGQAEQYDLSLAFLQYRNVMITLAGCWFVSVFIGRDRGRILSFARVVLWSVAGVAVLKILILAYCLESGIPVSVVMNRIGDSFGIKLMSFDLNEADPGVIGSRIMFSSDLLLAPSCFAAIAARRILGFGRPRMMVLLGLYLISAVLSFSRFHWAYCAGAILLGFLVAKGEKWMMVLVIATGVGTALSIPAIWDILALRFASNVVSDSDAPRRTQIAALKTFFWNAPLLGHGWGTFPRDCIRSELLPYAYEVELVALLGQIGIVGVLALFLLACWYFKPLFRWRGGGTAYRMALVCLLTVFLLGGLTNPMLLTSISSVSYGLLRALGEIDPTVPVKPVDPAAGLKPA